MTCDELRAYMNMTLQGERQMERMDQIRRHTRGCPACATYLSECLQLEQELCSLPSIPADAGILANIMRCIEQKSPRRLARPAFAVREIAWSAAMVLGLTACVLTSYVAHGGISWVQECWRINCQLMPTAEYVIDFLHQPLFIILVSGIGPILFAAVVFRRNLCDNRHES